MGFSSKGTQREGGCPEYGANLTTGQFLLVVLALALGTILEWYDFFVYSLLHATLSKVFFPSTNPTVQQVSFWGVFFVGFVARPIGSVIFGHIGDTRGRRLTLLLSIVFMAVPTVLIGCLPTYAHVGVAAPVLLSLLRLVQGVAMGGEFGSALVYLHEIASRRSKGLCGSIGFASAISGCMLGVLVVLVLEAALSPTQMMVFGWRLPFLASAVSASAALALRLHMPEPTEFLQEQQMLHALHNDLAAVTELRRTCSVSSAHGQQQQQHGDAAAATLSPRHSLTTSLPRDSDGVTSPLHSIDVECGESEGSSEPTHHTSNTCTAAAKGAGAAPAAAAAAAAADADAADATTVIGDTVTGSSRRTNKWHHYTPHTSSPKADQQQLSASAAKAAAGCCASLPFVMLLRWYWAGVLLQFLFEAWVSCSFYTLTTWVPAQMASALGIPVPLTRGMLVVNLLVCVLTQLAAGAASDRGLPRLVSSISVYLIAGAIIAPVLLFGFRPQGLAAAWVLHALLLGLVGWVLGLIPAACSPIYPASVRTTGFNLAHNMSMSWLGGLSPTIVTALTAVLGNKFMAPTVLLVAAAGVSLLAALALLWYAPAANRAQADRGDAELPGETAGGMNA